MPKSHTELATIWPPTWPYRVRPATGPCRRSRRSAKSAATAPATSSTKSGSVRPQNARCGRSGQAGTPGTRRLKNRQVIPRFFTRAGPSRTKGRCHEESRHAFGHPDPRATATGQSAPRSAPPAGQSNPGRDEGRRHPSRAVSERPPNLAAVFRSVCYGSSGRDRHRRRHRRRCR